ncbi:MAG: NAD(P)/FAD-dependent oxidoreductase [Planctomycetaceae bacterium]
MTSDWDVIVIGAGPAGSVAARQLALSGRRVLLLDKKRFPRRKVCGACLNHAAVRLLEEIGLGDVLSDSGSVELSGFDLRASSRRLSLPLPSGRAISRTVLDQKLVDAAIHAGVTFQDGVSATVGKIHGDRRSVELKYASDRLTATPSACAALECAPSACAASELIPRPAHADGVAVKQAKIILAADGLGHPSLCNLREVRDQTMRSSRIGAGCEVTEFPAEYTSGVIHMAVGRGGYVGLVRVESGALNIAAAFDARLIRESGGLALAAVGVLTQAGFPAIPAMTQADWIGTPALTRSTSPVAAERLFVLGDASGYVEPFTGEGMGWALASAIALAPLAGAACDDWQPALAKAWLREHSRLVRRRQRVCRMLAAFLRFPVCVRWAMFLLPKIPSLLQPLVRGVSLPQEAARPMAGIPFFDQ